MLPRQAVFDGRSEGTCASDIDRHLCVWCLDGLLDGIGTSVVEWGPSRHKLDRANHEKYGLPVYDVLASAEALSELAVCDVLCVDVAEFSMIAPSPDNDHTRLEIQSRDPDHDRLFRFEVHLPLIVCDEISGDATGRMTHYPFTGVGERAVAPGRTRAGSSVWYTMLL